MKTVKYYRSGIGTIYTEERAVFVPETGDDVCLPPDDDPSNEYEGGWHAFEVTGRRYKPVSGTIICYIEDKSST